MSTWELIGALNLTALANILQSAAWSQKPRQGHWQKNPSAV